MATKVRKAPVPMVYFENDNGKTPEEIDNTLAVYLPLLAGTLSGKNHGLDSMDVRNFLYYTRVSEYAPALTQLDLYRGEIKLQQGERVLSMLTLVRQGTSAPKDVMVRYQATGVMNPGFANTNESHDSLRLVMVDNHFQAVISSLQATRDRFAESISKTERRSLITKDLDIDAEDDGMIL